MGIIRLLLLLAMLWLAWRLVRNLLPGARTDQSQDTPPSAPPTESKMIRCEQCGVHIPEQEAFSARGHFFCSLEHQNAWLEDKNA